MIRHSSRPAAWLGALSVAAGWLAWSAPADAQVSNPGAGSLPINAQPGRRIAIDTPRVMFAVPDAQISSTIYLERCRGGCTIVVGPNDARIKQSSIPRSTSLVHEFADFSGGIGTPAADADWADVMTCMKEVYSPFNVTVTDVKPTSGLSYHMAIIAGNPGDVQQDNDILGVAPLSVDCKAIDNVISFSFANAHMEHDRALNICWTAAQESAHAFGLDHEYSFVGSGGALTPQGLACNDPMTYRTECGGEKFFRNQNANCGTNSVAPCRCGTSQNSHLKILSVFGPGMPITGVPTAAMSNPAVSGGLLGTAVTAAAGAKRGVSRVDFLFNGFKWADKPGATFGSEGQPNPSTYSVIVPAGLPDSIVDVQAIAFDDLGASSISAAVTVTKGAPCATATTCATGQKCEAGKCFWDPPIGDLGDKCSYAQFCKSGVCTGTAEQLICTQACLPNSADSCPDGFECVAQSDNAGVCFFSSAGCCSVDRGDSGWLHGGIAAVVLGLVLRRRRR